MSKYVKYVDDIAEECFAAAMLKIIEEQVQSIKEGCPAWGVNEYRAAVDDMADDIFFEVYVEAIRDRIKEKVKNLNKLV